MVASHLHTILIQLLFTHLTQFDYIFLSFAGYGLVANAQLTPEGYRATAKSEDGVIIDQPGRETLIVYGNVPNHFNREDVLQRFRREEKISISNDDYTSDCQDNECDSENKDSTSKTILETLSELLVGPKLGSNIQSLYETITQSGLEEELDAVKDDLSKLMTQELILRKRQAELGAYIEENLKKPKEQRNPTIEELVITEDDRLALLEHRLKRLRLKLTKQRKELEQFLKKSNTFGDSPSDSNNPGKKTLIESEDDDVTQSD